MSLTIRSSIIDSLILAARNADPEECCGLLLGQGDVVTSFQHTKNVHPTPVSHFEIDPLPLIEAHKIARTGGTEIIGYYHSHPNGLAKPSRTDADMAAGDGKAWAIIAGSEITFWRDGKGGFRALSYTLMHE